ncbi:hypothetical protein WR25_11147 [Diploscapter pachys]|uniref:VWFC domain-containing protein n=1 Tax=Diploscapter pachys TaxID=2018661 RepID=A0A2A2JJ01_9BILA|nr:hypothetical protein WR25_11147 [Diploscapter pachys]
MEFHKFYCFDVVIWLLFQLLGLTYAKKIEQPDATKSLHTWDMFKLRNVYLYAEIASGSGSLFTVTNANNQQQLVDVYYKRNQQVILTLPIQSDWRRRFIIPIPHHEKNATQLLFVLTKEEVSLYLNCEKVLSDPILQTNFLYDKTNLTLARNFDGELVELIVESGNPISEKCKEVKHPVFNFATENVEPSKKMINGNYFQVGEQVKLSNCSICECGKNGEMSCRVSDCDASIECSDAESCHDECHFENRIHENGEAFWPSECVRCTCEGSTVTCEFHQPTSCPVLTCLEKHQYRPENQCCPRCKPMDHCSVDSPCHKFAECHNSNTGPVCRCKEGFYGNGYEECEDINECNFSDETRESIGGCSEGTICVNTEGSYRCDCLPRHQRIDSRHCLNFFLI